MWLCPKCEPRAPWQIYPFHFFFSGDSVHTKKRDSTVVLFSCYAGCYIYIDRSSSSLKMATNPSTHHPNQTLSSTAPRIFGEASNFRGDLSLFNQTFPNHYPLEICHITIENHHFSWVNPL